MIRFILNDKTINTELSAGSTLLDFVRYERQLMGTKIGCREGDCGACTVLIGDIQDGKLTYQSMTSCIMPLGNANGKHVLTVEGINGQQLTPGQDLMVQNNGTQCGFCTPGFIMSMTGFTLSDEVPELKNAIKYIDGNICRCTGYKSIERALDALCQKLKDRPPENKTEWLVGHGHLPEFMKNIKSRLIKLQEKAKTIFKDNDIPADYFLGGGTDLLVQKPEVIRKTEVKNVFNDDRLRGIEIVDDTCLIGASVTVTDLAASSIFKKIFPDLEKYLKLVSSTPIRNMATLAGNFVNASPIGDMTVFFLALDSSIILNNEGEKRTLPLKHFFLDYKKLDKAPSEFIESIQFALPAKADKFNFEKVSKRTHLDIASVNTACLLSINEDGTIANAHISTGGVAPIPKYLFEASAFLKNKKLTYPVLKDFFTIVNENISPISDARGTAAYKRLLLRQLMLAHFIQFFGPTEYITKILDG